MVTTTNHQQGHNNSRNDTSHKQAPTDAPETVAYTTSGMLGGMIGPMVEDAAVTQQEKSLSNPCSFIALISIGTKAAGIRYCGTGHTSKDYAG